MRYIPKGVCSNAIDINTNNGFITSIVFFGGCSGNLKGIAALVQGMKIDEAIAKLKGITCGSKATSCPDQLATALEALL